MAVKSNVNQVRRRVLGRLRGVDPNSTDLQAAMFQSGAILATEAKRNVSRLRIVDTGRLLNAIDFVVTVGADAITLAVGTFGIRYARIHELGGPFTEAMRRAMFASLRRRGKRPRASKGVVVRGRIVARPYLRPAFVARRDDVIKLLRRFLEGTVKGK